MGDGPNYSFINSTCTHLFSTSTVLQFEVHVHIDKISDRDVVMLFYDDVVCCMCTLPARI